MLRSYSRLILIPLLLFTAALLLIHTHPYDDHELRQLLLPDGCPAPCFMGIRLGVTTTDEAIAILEVSHWVDQYKYEPDVAMISIKWNANSPLWLTNGSDNSSSGARILISDGVVDSIGLDTNLTLGEIQLAFGRSAFQQVAVDNFEGHAYLFYSALYKDTGVVTNIFKTCEGAQAGGINFQDKLIISYFSQFPIEQDIAKVYDDSWSDLLHLSCT